MAVGISANRAEILQIANAVAQEKSIDKRIVLEAMPEAASGTTSGSCVNSRTTGVA